MNPGHLLPFFVVPRHGMHRVFAPPDRAPSYGKSRRFSRDLAGLITPITAAPVKDAPVR
jgi:hypothetical protein